MVGSLKKSLEQIILREAPLARSRREGGGGLGPILRHGCPCVFTRQNLLNLSVSLFRNILTIDLKVKFWACAVFYVHPLL